MLKKRPNAEVQEEININMNYNKYNNTNISNNNNNYSPNNNNININLGTSKFTSTSSNSNSQMERRNSTISNSSSQLQASYKPRSRCDSYSGVGFDYNSHSGKMSPSTSSNPYYNTQIYGTHSHIADKVMYVTNAVAAAAAAAAAAASSQHVQEPIASPRYGRLRKPLTVDTNSNILQAVQPVSQTPKSTSSHSPHRNRFFIAQNINEHIHMDDDSDDDIAGQYATLLTVTKPSMEYHNGHKHQHSQLSRHPSMSTNDPDNEPQYSVIMSRSSRSSIKNLDNESQLENEVVPQSQGLGGYWMILDNNERIWCPLDNK